MPLAAGNADALPPKETRINRPCSWSKECQSGTEDTHEDKGPWVPDIKVRMTQSKDDQRHSRQRSPQTNQEKQSRADCQNMEEG